MSDTLQVASGRRVAGACASSSCHPSPVTRHPAGFTLIELLVVITIMGILAGLAVPALKNLGKSNAAVSASRQLLDDVGRARQLAISRHTTVYMVFVPTNFWGGVNFSYLSSAQQAAVTNLSEMQLAGYNFISLGEVGDQPGKHQWRYLSTWQSLPDNSFIAAWKFALSRNASISVGGFPIHGFSSSSDYPYVKFPFPVGTNLNDLVSLPFIAFNYLGQLTTNGVDPSHVEEYLPLAQGHVSYGYDGATKTPQLTTVTAADVAEIPPGNSTNVSYNVIAIDPLTARATLQFYKMP